MKRKAERGPAVAPGPRPRGAGARSPRVAGAISPQATPAVLMALLLWAPAALAYEIHPHPLATVKQLMPIHEQMTLVSAGCARTPQMPTSCGGWEPSRPMPPIPAELAGLIDGVRWPDNPVRTVRYGGIASFGYLFASKCRSYRWVRGGLLCKSHFGDLQFFHAMATAKGVSPEVTHAQVIDWARFLYGVATGAVADEAGLCPTLRSEKEPFSALLLALCDDRCQAFSCRKKWSVRQLFTWTDTNKFNLALPASTRDLALGSLLHLIQDSFAGGHVDRRNDDPGQETAAARISCGKIREFHTYEGQVSAVHGNADRRPELDATCSATGDIDDAILAGAKLLWMASQSPPAPWATVDKYLREHVFAQADRPRPSSPGVFACKKLDPKSGVCAAASPAPVSRAPDRRSTQP